ncbi:MAG: ATP-binding cassette domain-containing protein [Phycisphaerales bacterium]|nr:ATP-binding cassette domain-containing protein [Phycisphaerales bacterium]
MLEIRDLIHRYRPGEPPVLTLDDFRVDPGEQVVVTGKSGSGKSTLLHLSAGLMEPSRGGIRVDGVELRTLRAARRDRFRGRRIGMVFQTFHLLHGFSAKENILAALMFSDMPAAAHEKRADQLLGVLGIQRPNARVDTLSIGQQQRVAVARAVACSPALVLADEPTASLDPELARAALDLLQGACRSCGSALVCVTHDRSIVDRFDRHVDLASAAGSGGEHGDA